MPKKKRRTEDDVTVREVIDQFFAHVGKRSSVESEEERRRILDTFAAHSGRRAVSDCKPLDVLRFLNQQTRVKSNWTRRRWLATLKQPFNWANDMQLIASYPFRSLKFSRGEDRRDLTDAEFQAMLRHASTSAFQRVLIFLRFTGCRPGELRAMNPEHVHGQCVLLPHHKTEAKTRRPRRIVLGTVALKLVQMMLRNARPGEPVFSNSRGGRWTITALTMAMRRIRLKAGLPRDAFLYGTRHGFATHAVSNGVPTAVVAELLGHSGLQTVERYVHLADKSALLAAAVEQATKKSPPESKPPRDLSATG